MNRKMKTHLGQQRGIAMIVALLSLVLLAAIGMALMFMADTENSVNNNYRDSQKAYFAARAGVENVRLQLAGTGSLYASAIGLTMPLSAGGTGMIYVKNPTAGEAIDPTTGAGATTAANPYLDDQLCWEKYTGLAATVTPATSGPCGSNSQSTQLMSTSLPFTAQTLTQAPGVNGPDSLLFKWVRITNKQNLMGPLGQKVVGDDAGLGTDLAGGNAESGAEPGFKKDRTDGSRFVPAGHSARRNRGAGPHQPARQFAGERL